MVGKKNAGRGASDDDDEDFSCFVGMKDDDRALTHFLFSRVSATL